MSPPNNDSEQDILLQTSVVSASNLDVKSAGDRPSKRIKSNNADAGSKGEGHGVSSTDSSSTDSTTSNDNTHMLQCLKLLFAALPTSLSGPVPKSEEQKVSSFRQLWTTHGFRTSMVTSPRPAVSVYLDSCAAPTDTLLKENQSGREFLLTCIGMNPHQIAFEDEYTAIKNVYCLMLFLERMRNVRMKDMDDERITEIVSPWEACVQDVLHNSSIILSTTNGEDAPTVSTTTSVQQFKLQEVANSSPRILSQLLSKLTDIDHSLRTDQLLHEFNRITYENCTFANACLQRWLHTDNGSTSSTGSKQKYELDQVYYKSSPPGRYLSKYERITLHMKDPHAVEPSMQKLIFLPALTQVLTSKVRGNITGHPLDSVVSDMIESTWDNLLRNGYYVDATRKESLEPELKKFYLSGLLGGKEGNMPILLNVHFTPTYPLSLYLHGTAGSGKSSLVRALLPALNTAIGEQCDPELLVRFVKQNLNKPFATLQLELDLRPNNNDYSVMSIIQGRRMTLAQSKPGLVLVALEEMPSDVEGSDPKQDDVGRLIGMRFSGRKGDLKEDSAKAAPRNSGKRGISGDATIITIFTSNYDLECLESLKCLEMFQNISVIKVAPVSGEDRIEFALSYLTQRVEESLAADPTWTKGKGLIKVAQFDIAVGEGDTRPLVRYLRFLSFYLIRMMLSSQSPSNEVFISFDATTNITTLTRGEDTMELKPGSFSNLYAVTPVWVDPRASNTVAELQKHHPNLQNPMELTQILDFYFANTLAPAVIVSHDKQLVGDLVRLLAQSEGVHAINDIDPMSYKMMKSLYDATHTPNLRDNILDILHSSGGACSVAVELVCKTTDAQLQIREMIEDTPSMTAFSTEKSALKKDGLLFGVFVEGAITPEIKSRASLVI